MKILIAEDDQTSRQILETNLHKWNYEVNSAVDGNEAWKILMRQDAPRLAWWYENRIAEICGRIGASMPKTLTLEEQGLFALGYYQQLAALRSPKENNKEEGEK